jgi:hypothetical protein
MTLATVHNFGVYVRFGKTSPGGTIWTVIGSYPGGPPELGVVGNVGLLART